MQRVLSVMVGGESRAASGEDGCGNVAARRGGDWCALQWWDVERREEGEEAGEKEMVEEGEKRTRCFPSEGVRPKEDADSAEELRVQEEVEGRSHQPGIVGKRRHERRVSTEVVRVKDGEEEARDFCLSSCTKEEESWLPERAARDAARRAKIILVSMALLALVGLAHDVMSARLCAEAEGDTASSDFLR